METPTRARSSNSNLTELYPSSSNPNPAWSPSTLAQPQRSQMQNANAFPPRDPFNSINLSKISALSSVSGVGMPVFAAPSRNSTAPQNQSFSTYPENMPGSKLAVVYKDPVSTQNSTRGSMSFVSPPVEIKPGLMSSVNNGPFRRPIEDQSGFRYLGADYLAEIELRNRYRNTLTSEERSISPLKSTTTRPIRAVEPQYSRDADGSRSLLYEYSRKPNIYDLKYQQAMDRGPLPWRRREEAERIPSPHNESPAVGPGIKTVNKKAKQIASKNPLSWYNPALGGRFVQPIQPHQQPIRPPSKSHISLPNSTSDFLTNGTRSNPALLLKDLEFDGRYDKSSYLTETHDHRNLVNDPPKTPIPPESKRRKFDLQFETPDNLVIHDKFSSPRRLLNASPKLPKTGALETDERHKRKDFDELLSSNNSIPATSALLSSLPEVKSQLRPPSSGHANAQESSLSSHNSKKSSEAENVQASSDSLPSRIDSEIRTSRMENEGNKTVSSSPSLTDKQDELAPEDETISQLQPYNALLKDPLMVPTDSGTSFSYQPSKETNNRRTTAPVCIVVNDEDVSRPSSTGNLDLDATYSHMNYLENKLGACTKMNLTDVPDRVICHRDYLSYLQNNFWTIQRKYAQVFVWCLSRVIYHSAKEHVHQLVNFYLSQLKIRVVIDKASIPFSFKFSPPSHLKPKTSNGANSRYAKILSKLKDKVSDLEDEGRREVDRIETSKILLPHIQSINDIPTDFGASRSENSAAEIQSRLTKIKEALYFAKRKCLEKKQAADSKRNLNYSYITMNSSEVGHPVIRN